MEIKEYVEKNKIKLVEHKDGTFTIRYSKKFNEKDSFTDFIPKLLKPAKKIRSITNKEFVPDPNNYNYKDWPIIKVKIKFQ